MPGFFRVSLTAICAATLFLLFAHPSAPKSATDDPDITPAAEIREHYTKHEYRIPMRDGVKLFTAVYIPKDTSVPYPFLIDRTPYSVAPYGADHYPKRLGPSIVFLTDGFIFVEQDVRGRYMSEGKFQEVTPHRDPKKSPTDVDESTDTYDTIEWVLHNVPNNNGKAGIWGISYPGFYAAAGIIDSHPALKAASPQAPVSDLYMGDDAYHNGAFMLAANFGFYTFFQPRTAIAPPPAREPRYDYGTTDGYEFYLQMGPLSNARKLLKQKESYWDDQVEHPNYDAFWKARDISARLKNVHCAVMAVGGWFDAEDLEGPRRVFHAVARMNPSTPDKLVIGPWVHGGWAGTPGDKLGDIDFASKTSDFYNSHILLPFFRQYLKDAQDPKLPTAYVFETGTNVWRQYDSWPPKDTEKRTLYFHDGGKLSFDAAPDSKPDSKDDSKDDSKAAYDEYISDPSHPVPFIDAISTDVPREYMDADQRFLTRRGDVLVYQTASLQEDVTVAGAVSPRLWVSTSGTDSDFDVKLIDVYPMDYPNPEPNPKDLEMGGYQQLVRGEPFRGKFRNSFEKPEAFGPNQPTALNFDLPDVNHTFRHGHRIMIQIHSSWFPLVDRNPQKFINILEATPADFQKATERIYHSKQNASSIVLPVLK
ncbi:MAG TPA: CocE/NonD family hydrolase [Candidatus Sulfotelmatobacter sp.]|nr:CocE/NonD family hydrolase [Candidatus Sulfotelmatobacter sp.]